jgi:uncharacterized protein YjbI with pentapeptide repeats
MSLGDVLDAKVIVVIAVLLLIGTIIPGVRLYWPRRSDPVSRSDLGVALMGGALIAFAVLVLQLMIQYRAEDESRQRQELSDRESLLLVLGQSPNLSGLDLHEEDLSEAYLNQKVLRGADLTGAEMTKVRLQGAVLFDADLKGADLTEARLDRADLRYADLSGATLVGASLTGAKLEAASLVKADLSGADLSDAWVHADLRGADLRGAKLVGAQFARANLERADLRGADLDFADLRGANLKGAKLRRTETGGIGDAKLDSPRDLSFVRYDGGTKWPDDFDWEGEPPPVCKAADCWLKRTTQPVEGQQTELLPMREGLEQAARDDDRLPGWWVDERRRTINAHAPGDRARFKISMDDANGRTAKSFANGFILADPEDPNPIAPRRKPIPGVKVVAGTDTYAETFQRRDEESKRHACYVAVYFVRGRRAFRLWGWAPREVFSQFQLDFVKLFRTTGVSGDLFPDSKSGEDGCT